MDPRRHVEQIEVIEHHITEGRRPISSEHLELIPTSEYKTTTENFLTTTSALPYIESDTRYHLTGERDFSREPSFLHQSAGGLRDLPPVQHSTPERNSSNGINNYGYDVHEVRTSGGGARIVQSHGSGFVDASPLQPQSSLVMHDRSLETIHNQSGSRTKEVGFSGNVSAGSQTEHLHSILKTASDETWRRFGSSEENSLARKDSYKKMQDQAENVSVYAPSSQSTMITKESRNKWAFENNNGQEKDDGTGCWSRLKQASVKLINQIHDAGCNPRKLCAILFLFLCLLLLFLFLWFIVSPFFASYSTRKLWMYPPYCEDCVKKNPALGTYRPPSKLYVHYYSPAQAHFEIVGNPPLKSNSFIAVDFDTGFVAIADHALTNRHGQHTTCFLMELDRAALPSMEILREGLAQSYDEVKVQYGWQEYWQYIPEAIDANQADLKFKDKIPDCQNVKWYYLKHSVHTRDSSCTDCYDFCLPDYAVQRREKYDDHMTLSIRRLNCFRIYVSEWNRFQLKADDTGGHWEYPVHPQYTQRDSDGEWTNWNPAAFIQ